MFTAMEESRRLVLAKQLVNQLESGDSVNAAHTVDLLAGFSENNLFQEGKG